MKQPIMYFKDKVNKNVAIQGAIPVKKVAKES